MMTEERRLGLREAIKAETGFRNLCPETDVVEFDSLEVMGVCLAVEKYCSVEISFAEVQASETYGALEDLVAERAK